MLSNKKSFISGLNLSQFEGSDRIYSCFSHVLSKKQYSYFRLYLKNLVLINPDEHFLVDQGTIEDQVKYSKKFPSTNWDILNKLKIELLREYDEAFPKIVYGARMKYNQLEVKIKIRSLNYQYVYTLERAGHVKKEVLPGIVKLIESL